MLAATVAGGYFALATYSQDQTLSVGAIRLDISPGHRGALDVYVPLVDWGARFEAIRLPVRLRVDLRTVDRGVVTHLAQGESLDVDRVRREARDAIASYLRSVIGIAMAAAAALGLLTAFALRHSGGPRLRYTAGLAIVGSLAIGAALIVFIPPRGPIDEPQYYAYGPDIPRALEAVEAAQRSSDVLDQELDAQLVGIARLVIDPGERSALANRPQVTVASDLHNNAFALTILERNAGGDPLFFAGDLTDRGSPFEASLVRRIVRIGHPFVFVSGNHDSDSLERDLARNGAIVLTQTGRLMPNGLTGPVIVDVDGLRVAGYSDPFERREAENYRDRYHPPIPPSEQDKFTAWLRPLLGKVDVVLVHEPELIEPALTVLKDDPPARPLVFVVGHTHKADLQPYPGVTVVNGGSVGAGGTGNLTESTPVGLARLIYTVKPRFQPLAADLVSINPGTGSSTARRERLD